MNRFLLGALATGAIFVLTSFALSSRSAPTTGGPAWTVSQYQLDRAFRIPVSFSSAYPSSYSMQVPATEGFILTEVRRTSGDGFLSVTVNGVSETFDFYNASSAFQVFNPNPPIIARPGDTVTFSHSVGGALTIVFAGYTTLPGET